MKPDQLVNLLQLREDTDRSEAQKVILSAVLLHCKEYFIGHPSNTYSSGNNNDDGMYIDN